jgi:hypothetical protein
MPIMHLVVGELEDEAPLWPASRYAVPLDAEQLIVDSRSSLPSADSIFLYAMGALALIVGRDRAQLLVCGSGWPVRGR